MSQRNIELAREAVMEAERLQRGKWITTTSVLTLLTKAVEQLVSHAEHTAEMMREAGIWKDIEQ